jgi:hypothetical protein
MGDVVTLDIEKITGKVPPERVLSAALVANLQDVTIVGTTADGKLYCAFSDGNVLEILGSLDVARDQILRALDE